MNISSKFVSKTTQQNKNIEDLLKNIKSSEGVLKRKEPEVACSEEARKRARYEDSDDEDDQPQGSSDLHKGEKTPTPKPVETQKESTPSESNQHKEKGTERHSTSTSAEDIQATLKSPVPIIFLRPSTSEEVEVVDVEEYVFKNAQPHHTSTTSELRESPEIDGYISEPSKEDPPQTMEPEIMVVDEQAPSENPVQKASIGLPAKVFNKPSTFLESNPEASIKDHFRYIYCEFNMADTLVIPLNPRIREDMPDYERRFIRDKTKPRAQKIYEFNDNDLVNLNPYDLPHLYAYCSARYDHGRREIRMGMVEVRRAMEAYVKHRAKRDIQIALNLGEEKLEGEIVSSISSVKVLKIPILLQRTKTSEDEDVRGRRLQRTNLPLKYLSEIATFREDIRDGFIRDSEDNVRALKTFSLKMFTLKFSTNKQKNR
ncbi:hypothetical protein L6452_22165 [Arctium lappa]|uniref:Uncharacterized protein n=1 Tax=Arctium lappa TaxID=4217 RepID=A0ACB9AZU4_ARCLA|nr:hypothetical protein L6452_22165 [Arctium lappa]